jgi:hypothetical protein
MPILGVMTRSENDPAAEAVSVSGDLAGTLASALLWLDVATLSLERDDPRDLRAALSQARAQLHGVIGALTTADRRTADRRMGEQREVDRRSSGRSTADRRAADRRDGDRRTGDRRAPRG